MREITRRGILWIVSVTMLISLALAFMPVRAFAASASTKLDVSKVRVLLSIGSVTSHEITLDGNYYLNEDKTVKLQRNHYTVKISSGKLNLLDANGATVVKGKSSLTFVQCAKTAGRGDYAILKANQRSGDQGYNYYKGNITYGISDGVLTCVNTVWMEDYVQGVIGQEMSNSWELEALKAQAVVSRSYATSYFSTSRIYDVTDTTRHQVYRGYRPLDTKVAQAVEETRNQFVTCGTQIVQAFFAASNGGLIEPTQHAWSGSEKFEPWQWAMYDEYDLRSSRAPESEIKLYKDGDGMSANVEKYLKDLVVAGLKNNSSYDVSSRSDVEIVKISSISASGLASELHEKDMSNTALCTLHSSDLFKKPSNAFDSCPNYSTYKVTMTVKAATPTASKAITGSDEAQEIDATDATIEPEQEEIAIDPNNGTPGRVETADAESQTQLTEKAAVQAASEESSLKDRAFAQVKISVKLDATQFKASGKYPVLTQSDYYGRLITVENNSDYFSLWYRRFGHGVGMSQHGADQQAKEGRTYKQIVQFYFPNTEITKLSYSEPELETLSGNSNMTGSTPTITATGTVSGASTVNIRSGPSTSYSKLGTVNQNSTVKIVMQDYVSGWHQIYFDGKVAYISATYVSNIKASAQSEAKIKLNATSATMGVGVSGTLKSNISGTTWKSSNAKIAKVSSSGKVTALKEGTATITGTSPGGQTATCKITVSNKKYEIAVSGTLKLNATSATMGVGVSGTLKSNISGTTWKSSNAKIAKVSSSGKVTALKEGTATITGTSPGGQTATCKITVSNKKYEIATKGELRMQVTSATMKKGSAGALAANISGCTWKSSNSSVVKVTSKGKLTALKAGTATITATSPGGQTATCKITVLSAASYAKNLYITATAANLTVGKTTRMYANMDGVTWSSSDESVLTIDENGAIVCVGAGAVTVKCVSDTGLTASCKITVYAK